GRSGRRPRRVRARSTGRDDADRRARARPREGLDQDRAEHMSELLTEERIEELDLPDDLPVLPLKETVVFPESMTPLAIGQERSIRLIEDVIAGDDRLLALVTVKDPDVETPGFDDLYSVGTAAMIHKMIKVPDGTLRILVQGLRRIRIERPVRDDPYLAADIVEVPDVLDGSPEVEALMRNVQNLFARV